MKKKPAIKKPDAKEIAAQLAWLETNRNKVRSHSAFGDNHHAAIDAQILVLKGDGTEPMGEDEIYERWGNPDAEDSPQNVLDACLEIRNWLDGQSNSCSPQKNWESLVSK